MPTDTPALTEPVAEVVERLRTEFFALCESIEEQYGPIGQRDLEGKEGAFARGRTFEAKSIRREMGERFRVAIGELKSQAERLSRERDTGVPEGFWLAPNELDDAMIEACAGAFFAAFDKRVSGSSPFHRWYEAIRSAAPQPPTVSTQGWQDIKSAPKGEDILVAIRCLGGGAKVNIGMLLFEADREGADELNGERGDWRWSVGDDWQDESEYGEDENADEVLLGWLPLPEWPLIKVPDISTLTRERDQAREALANLRLTARVLLQNAEGCAANHYGADFEQHGPPGWLADCENAIKSAETVIAGSMQEVTHDT